MEVALPPHPDPAAAGASITAALRRAATVEDLPGRLTASDDPVALAAALAADGPRAAEFVADVAESTANLALSRAAAAAAWPPVTGGLLDAAGAAPDPLVFIEQSVTDGHPRHPLRRTRRGMSPADQSAYAPEHRPVVDLLWQPVPAGRFHHAGTWPHHRDGTPLLPVHPWQHRHLTDAGTYPDLPPVLDETLPAAPLMSLRTLAPVGDPRVHVKTSVGVHMTSAVRIVSPAAVANGPALSAYLPGLAAAPGFTILAETGAAAVLDTGGPRRDLAAIVRVAPAAHLPAGTIALPVAALTARTPHPRLILGEAIARSGVGPHEWWRALLEVLLPGPLRLAGRGAGLEAHGQNLLVVLDRGLPVAAMYRDFGGVRLHGPSLPDAPRLAGDITTGDLAEVHRTLLGALFAVVLTELVDAMGAEHGAEPGKLWAQVAAVADDNVGNGALREALYAQAWPVKATTAMRLAADPLTPIWARVPNPLADS